MQYRETSRDMVRLTFIAESVLAPDEMVVRPAVAVISGNAVLLWYWSVNR